MKRLILLLAALGLLAAGAAYGLLWASGGPAGEEKAIVIEEGSSLGRVAEELEAEGLIPGNATTFKAMARLFGSSDPVQAGEFRIPAGMSAAGILDHLQHGRPVQRFVTIPEGTPSVLVRDKLMAIPHLTGAIDVPEEGSVLPDTYSYRRGDRRQAVLERMQEAMDEALAELWPARKPHSAVKTPREAVILASIVEKETARPSERRMVAGVYTNRLKQGMKLDADPTVIYPVTRGRPLGRRIRRSELDDVNAYNTYAMTGLPRGPIANPGRESIAAVLDPAATEALYFVADGTGGHVFAETLAEHNANVARWYEIRRRRGEM
ncbi:MAG: endolytic transglycosylase MltG [Sphingomonadaceae bacterium]